MAPRIFWIEAPPKGRLAIVTRPLGGERLAAEIAGLKSSGLTALLSLLDEMEAAELGLAPEAETCAASGIDFINVPVADRGLPSDDTAFRETTAALAARIAGGAAVAIHCRAGIGRSSLAAASILVHGGVTPGDALARVARARGLSVPDTEEQRRWISALRQTQ